MSGKKSHIEELSLFPFKQMRGGFSSDADEALAILADHLRKTGGRQTPERTFLLHTIYNMDDLFTVEELQKAIADSSTHVSKTTIYSNIKLFEDLHLIVSHRLKDTTCYERALHPDGICRQICTACGKVQRYKSKAVMQVVNNARWPRFRKEHFTLYIYGVCQSCTKKKQK